MILMMIAKFCFIDLFLFMGLPNLTLLGLLALEAVALAVAEVIHQVLLIYSFA